MPGTATLNKEGYAETTAVSCASAGNCSAGGFYTDASAAQQAFVASETGGTWQDAEEVPGIAALNTGRWSQVNWMSCASAGNCSAGGFYHTASADQAQEAFLVSQVNGTWGTAIEVPGTAALNPGGSADITSVSCPSAGNCSAGGYYTDASYAQQAFVVKEVNGTWRDAEEVPGTGTLNAGGYAAVNSVSCPSTGNCSAGGYYNSSSTEEAFVASEVNGTWHKAGNVPGTSGFAKVTALSCASVGNCSAGGAFRVMITGNRLFVASEVNGTWHKAEEVPGTATFGRREVSALNSVSCASAGNCSAGGSYDTNDNSGQEAFVASEVNGTWHKAEQVLGTGGNAQTYSVSCPSAGNCSAGGTYYDSSNAEEAFVVDETNGTWPQAIEVPGIAALNTGGDAGITSISCPSASNCGAGGYYATHSRPPLGFSQAFVVNKT